MYMRGLSAAATTSAGSSAWIGTPQEFLGTGCPAGMIATGAAKRDSSGNYSVMCAQPRPAPPPAPSAPAQQTQTFNPTITVSPNIQAQISPQISPGFIQSSGGGTQQTGATQSQPGGQSAQGGGSGITAADLQQILSQQEAQRAAADAQRRQEQQEALARQQAEYQAAQQAIIQQMKTADEAARKELEDQLTALKSQPPVIVPGAASIPLPESTAVSTTVTAPASTPRNVYLLGGLALVVIGGALYVYTRKKRSGKR